MTSKLGKSNKQKEPIPLATPPHIIHRDTCKLTGLKNSAKWTKLQTWDNLGVALHKRQELLIEKNYSMYNVNEVLIIYNLINPFLQDIPKVGAKNHSFH